MADALIDGGFVDATPLWFYVLKEAEVLGQGEHLGEVGSRIVCTTLIGQIQADPDSYLNRSGGPGRPPMASSSPAARSTRSARSWSSRACTSDPIVRAAAAPLRRGGPVT